MATTTIPKEVHATYYARSPYYAALVDTFGKHVSDRVAQSVCKDHGTTLSEYRADTEDKAEKVSALALVSWLGY